MCWSASDTHVELAQRHDTANSVAISHFGTLRSLIKGQRLHGEPDLTNRRFESAAPVASVSC